MSQDQRVLLGRTPNGGLAQSQRASSRGTKGMETRIGLIKDGPGGRAPQIVTEGRLYIKPFGLR